MATEHQVDVASSAEDKVGWTMTCIRAVEKINLKKMRKCVDAYPDLAEIIDPDNPNPTLFAMAADTNLADASALGGPMEAEKPQVTASGLKITDLVVGTGDEATRLFVGSGVALMPPL